MKDFAEMNGEYAKFFTKGQEPTRVCVAVTELPKKAKVLIEAIAAIEEKEQKH